jgi:hypothetical protein
MMSQKKSPEEDQVKTVFLKKGRATLFPTHTARLFHDDLRLGLCMHYIVHMVQITIKTPTLNVVFTGVQ